MHAGQVVESAPTRTIFHQPGASVYAGAGPVDTARGPRRRNGTDTRLGALVDQPPAGLSLRRPLQSGHRCAAASRGHRWQWSRPTTVLPVMVSRNAVPPLIEVRDLRMHFPLGGIGSLLSRIRGLPAPVVRAVESVSFDVGAGETLALVGESGCGKSTVARCLLRLLDPTAGSIRYDGAEIATLDREAMKPLRRDIQMVFQDPTASLNPRLTVRYAVEEPLMLHTQLEWGRTAGTRRRGHGGGWARSRTGRPVST